MPLPPEGTPPPTSTMLADGIGMFLAVIATLSLASIVGAVLLPVAVVGGGGYLAVQWLRSQPTPAPAEGAAAAAAAAAAAQAPGWLERKEKALEKKLHALNTGDGGYVMVVREGSDAGDSEYTVADAKQAVETLAAAFRGAFDAGDKGIRVDTVGRYVRCALVNRHASGTPLTQPRVLLTAIKAAVVAPGHVYPRIGPGKLQLTVDDRIHAMATRTMATTGADAKEAPALVEHGFPLHGDVPMLLSVDRQRLLALKSYYGEQIAYYFEFVFFYNGVMMWPTVAGVVVHVYSSWVGEQNALVPLYAAFMMIWATLLTEFWKRQQAELAFDWDVKARDVEDRPQFKGVARIDDVTGKRVYVDTAQMLGIPMYVWRSTLSYSVTMVLLAVSATGVLWTMLINDWRERLPDIAQPIVAQIPDMVAEQVPGILQVVWLTVLGAIYGSIATLLNDFENHKTEDQYQDQLIIKRFGFEFVQWMFGLFYCAFWVQDREELQGLLFGAMVTRQIVRQVKETAIPFAQMWWAERAENKKEKEKPAGLSKEEVLLKKIEHEHGLEEYDEFNDFLDMTLQFAHLTLFSSAWPLAALCAWSNNLLEMRTDFFKLSATCQRPFPQVAVGIGSWLWTFEFLSVGAVVTNTALIGWTTPIFDETAEYFGYANGEVSLHYKLLVLVGIEHMLLCVKGLITALVPDVPERVETEVRRRKWLAEEALARVEVKAASGFARSLSLARSRRAASEGVPHAAPKSPSPLVST